MVLLGKSYSRDGFFQTSRVFTEQVAYNLTYGHEGFIAGRPFISVRAASLLGAETLYEMTAIDKTAGVL